MKPLPALIVFSLLLTGTITTFAQKNCPPELCTEPYLKDSCRVIVVDIGKNDLYYLDRKEYIGDTLYVKGDLVFGKECDYSGTLWGPNKKLLYFSHIQLKKLLTNEIIAAPDCREGAAFGYSAPEGAVVKLLAIHSSDIYSLIDPGLVGKEFKVRTQLHNFKDCWYEGTVEDENKNVYVFTKVQIQGNGVIKVELPVTTKIKILNGKFIDELIPKNTRLTILDIASTDIMYEKKGIVIGKKGKCTEDLKHVGNGWYTGNIITDDGSSYYFFKVAIGPGN